MTTLTLEPDVRKALEDARALVKKGWAQDYNAMALGSAVCDPRSKAAARWCANGALVAATGDADSPICSMAYDVLRAAAETDGSLSAWNDAPGRTQAEVLALFDKALGK